MGMYDHILWGTPCPRCGKNLENFQSKDGPCIMLHLDFTEVKEFYDICADCHTFMKYRLEDGFSGEPTIEDYKITIEMESMPSLKKLAKDYPRVAKFIELLKLSRSAEAL